MRGKPVNGLKIFRFYLDSIIKILGTNLIFLYLYLDFTCTLKLNIN